jgi:uncharacterized protein
LTRSLLDVNVLIALLDAAHVHHSEAMRWFEQIGRKGWASCALTQLGCIRIMSNPAYPNRRSPSEVAARLNAAAAMPKHEFWDADNRALTAIDWREVLSSRHTTDVYLLGLAISRGGRVVTFDKHIPLAAIHQARAEHVFVIDADS